MTKITRRTLARGGALGARRRSPRPRVARAQTRRWRMVTSWPKRLPGPGMSAERVAERIARALRRPARRSPCQPPAKSCRRFEVLDAVGGGVAEMGHTASFYWQGKEPAAAFFTTVPFGLTPTEHVAWVDAGGGQALWDELYAPFGVKPFMGGNTGVCMGGWFRREIKSARRRAGLEDPLARPRRRGLSPARRDAADHAARRNSHQPAIRRDRRRRIRRPRHRHRARALSRGAALLRPRLQQAERHRRMHRLAQGLGDARRGAARRSSRMPARPRPPSRSPRWSGSTSRRSPR